MNELLPERSMAWAMHECGGYSVWPGGMDTARHESGKSAQLQYTLEYMKKDGVSDRRSSRVRQSRRSCPAALARPLGQKHDTGERRCVPCFCASARYCLLLSSCCSSGLEGRHSSLTAMRAQEVTSRSQIKNTSFSEGRVCSPLRRVSNDDLRGHNGTSPTGVVDLGVSPPGRLHQP